MLRRVVAELLRESPILAGFAGGVYPQTDDDPSVMSVENFPLAFATSGDMLPTILVQDSTIVPYGPLPHSARATIRVLYWQQYGRAQIDDGIRATIAKLGSASRSPAGLYVYRFKFAGTGPSVTDPELRDAEHGSTVWQAELLIGG